MKRMLFKSLFTLALALGLQQSASATIHTILVSDFQFTPSSLNTVMLGDTIKWKWVNGSHTTTSTTIPGGAASWDHPIASANDSFVYVPTVPGSYSYKCTPHVSMNQVGSFIVSPITSVAKVPGSVAFKLSPNPARGQISIKSDAHTMNVNLVDVSGRWAGKLEQVGNTGSEKVFSLQGIAAGLYMLQIKSDDMVAIERLVVGE